MIRTTLPSPWLAMVATALVLAGCASSDSGRFSDQPPPPQAPQILPASIPAQDLVGRWGIAAYHREQDRARTEVQARGQCRQPYNITRGPSGGIMMHLADQAQPIELILKGGPGGKNYVGPPDEAGGGSRDREIVVFDGKVLILKWMDPEVAGRYGITIYARCSPRA